MHVEPTLAGISKSGLASSSNLRIAEFPFSTEQNTAVLLSCINGNKNLIM